MLISKFDIVWCLFTIIAFPPGKCGRSVKIYSLPEDIKALLVRERDLIREISSYFEMNRLTTTPQECIYREIVEFGKLNTRDMDDIKLILEHPLGAYQSVVRLDSAWKSVVAKLNDDIGSRLLFPQSLLVEIVDLANSVEIKSSSDALYRIMSTYQIPAEDLFRGIVGGIAHRPLVGVGLISLVESCIDNLDYDSALKLLQHSVNGSGISLRSNPQNDNSSYSCLTSYSNNNVISQDAAGLYYTAVSLIKSGKRKEGESIINQLLSVDKSRLPTWLITKLKAGDHLSDFTDDKTVENLNLKRMTRLFCRRKLNVNPSVNPNMNCIYNTKNDPFLLLQPVKQEFLSKEPELVMIHDIVLDSEVDFLITNATEQMKPSRISSRKEDSDPNRYLPEIRSSLTSYISCWESDVTRRLCTRIGHITNLDSNSFERINVVYYGPGAHFDVHHDFFKPEWPDRSEYRDLGNRIASVFIYLNDVTLGGETIFPLLRLRITPQKGSAVMWFNLDTDGETLFETAHAGCPVAMGSKWGVNIWMRERGQEFRRPCTEASHEDGT